MSRRDTQKRLMAVRSHTAAGLAVGVAAGLLYFVLEPLIWCRESHGYFGAGLNEVLWVYLLFGAALGLAAGLASGALVRVSTPINERPHPVGRIFPAVGLAFTALFVVRELTFPELRTFQIWPLVALLLALAVWVGLVVILARRWRGRGVPSEAWVSALVMLVAVGIWLRVGSSRLPIRSEATGAAPNIVLVVVDALRADHLSSYGYARDTSPNIDGMVRAGVQFDRAYAHGNRTIISMPSLFTSMYPSFHGAVGSGEQKVPLPDSRTTLAEMCQGAGYTTVGVMSNVYLKTPFGMTQGFDEVEEFNTARYQLSVYRALDALRIMRRPSYRAEVAPDAGEVTDTAIRWLKRMDDRRSFLFVHYMDVHHPYDPPAPFATRFGSPGTGTDAKALFRETVALTQGTGVGMAPERLQRLIDLYDGCIQYVDDEIGRIIRFLEEDSSGRETIVIFTSDHGDEFLEHGSLYHNNVLIEELIRVPLVVWSNKGSVEARRFSGLVRHVDILPTIGEWIGAVPGDGAVGQSLLDIIEGHSDQGASESFSEGDFCTAVVTPDWKLMHVDTTDTYQLYDLEDGGAVDAQGEHAEIFRTLKDQLDDYRSRTAALVRDEQRPVSQETLRQLKALGYF